MEVGKSSLQHIVTRFHKETVQDTLNTRLLLVLYLGWIDVIRRDYFRKGNNYRAMIVEARRYIEEWDTLWEMRKDGEDIRIELKDLVKSCLEAMNKSLETYC